jgi:RNA polymerase sigma factor (sigma-70 family)
MNKTKNLSDATLILKCREGDVAAWEALVLRYQRLIYIILRRSGLDKDQAAEVFHNVFVRLIDALDGAKPPAPVREWLIATACEEARRRSDASPYGVESTPLSDALIQRLIEQNAVYVAVASLDARCRTTLSQLFYCNPPTPRAEVADMIDVFEQDIELICEDCFGQLLTILDQRSP